MHDGRRWWQRVPDGQVVVVMGAWTSGGNDGSSDNDGVNRDDVKINLEENVLELEIRGENEIGCFRWFS